MREHELSDRFEYFGRTHDRRKLSFETIVAVGKDATIMHHPIAQQEGVLKDGDLILFDLGYRSNGYCADISRTYPINGKFSDLQRKVYEAVLNTNKAVIEYVKPGLTIADLQAFAIENLKKESMRLGLIKNEEEIAKYYEETLLEECIDIYFSITEWDPINCVTNDKLKSSPKSFKELCAFLREDNRIIDYTLPIKEHKVNYDFSLGAISHSNHIGRT
jgi:hypothetical protein